MEKYAIVIDSCVYLLDEEIEKFGIKRVSLNIIDGDKSYKEVDVTSKYVFDRLDKGHKLTTSQPSPGEFLNSYEEFLEMGYEKIFVICFSEALSGTYQSAILARQMLDEPKVVHVFDTKLAAFGNEMIVFRLIELIKEEKSFEEIIKRIDSLSKVSNLIFTIENLTSLIRSGRLSRTKGAIGTVLRIKPLIQMKEGKLDLFKSARTHKKVIDEIIMRVKETTKNFNTIFVRILSHNSKEQAKALQDELERVFKNIKISYTENLGPIFCLHLGKKGYGLSWCGE